MEKSAEIPIRSFKTQKDWAAWLEKNYESAGVWLRFFKKASGVKAVNYDQALEEALCYGWIDSQVKKYDEQSYLQKFTPRRSKSIWSKINTQHIERLIKEGRMKPAGMKQVEEAKKDGRWEQAYHSPSEMTIPDDFMKDLQKNKKAYEFFKSLNKSNTYAIGWRIQTAKKPETKAKRIKDIIQMLSEGKKFH